MADEQKTATGAVPAAAAKNQQTFTNVAALALPAPAKKPRQVFVAYPYKIPEADYRKVFRTLGKAFQVEFVFADEKITNLHILQKISTYIRESRFGIYDSSYWNPNVALELGLAFGLNERAFIVYDPNKIDKDEVPSDLRGIDRIQYKSFAELEAGITRLLGQELPVQPTHDMQNQLVGLREQALRVIREAEGLKIGDIARVLGINVDLAKLIVRPMVGLQLETKGETRGKRYFARPGSDLI
jgi:predicted nucleotide-binding protein